MGDDASRDDQPEVEVENHAALATAAAGSSGGAGGHVDGASAKPILEKDGFSRFPTLLERYFTSHVLSNHQVVSVHSNGLCMLNVDPSAPMMQPPHRITAVNYRSHDSKNLLANTVSGKKKIGAVFVLPRDMVCTLAVSDGSGGESEVALFGCVRGSVIEVNQRLIEHPELLGTPEGYVAIIMPKLSEKRSIGEELLELDRETPLNQPSTNSKRKADGKPVRSAGNGGGGDGDGGGGPKKKKRKSSPCFEYQRTGACKFGDRCKFAHEQAASGATCGAPTSSAGEPPESGAASGAPTSFAAEELAVKSEAERESSDGLALVGEL